MADEKATPKSKSKSAEDFGDQNAPPGTPEHLGSDRPYEGGEYMEPEDK
jgi:hypothetical protein